jgi:hypothetical protein
MISSRVSSTVDAVLVIVLSSAFPARHLAPMGLLAGIVAVVPLRGDPCAIDPVACEER